MGQDAGRPGTVLEEAAAVFFSGDPEPDGVPLQRDGAVAYDAIKAESRYMQHFGRIQLHLHTVLGGIGVNQLSRRITVHVHVVRQQRVEAHDAVLAGPDDLTVGVTPQEQVGHHGLAHDEGGHFLVGFIMQEPVQRMICRFPAAAVCFLIDGQRQGGDGLRDDPYTSVYCRNLDRGLWVDGLAGPAGAEVKGRRSGHGVLRSIAGPEQEG